MDISVNKLFGLEGDKWMRHANPVSVWTRFAVLPLLFPPPRSTRNWASKGVFGELPPQFRSKVLSVTYAIQVVGLAVLVYGLVILQTAKAWFIDRMVLLFEHMKGADPTYAAWEY
jgi:hypothetical protein